MKFRISVGDTGKGEQAIAEADFANFASAHDWAKALLGERADDENYFLRSEDGTFNARYVKTVGGQWYAIGLPPKPVRDEHS
jgi:hypothetical protein